MNYSADICPCVLVFYTPYVLMAHLPKLLIVKSIEKHSTIDQEGKPLDSTWRALFTLQN